MFFQLLTADFLRFERTKTSILVLNVFKTWNSVICALFKCCGVQ